MTAAWKDLAMQVGSTFSLPVIWRSANGQPVDVLEVGTVAVFEIRLRRAGLYETLISVSSDDGHIVLGNLGFIVVTITADEVDALTFTNAFYTLTVTYQNKPYRILEGTIVRTD